jgi:di/tricarboxylate transporter
MPGASPVLLIVAGPGGYKSRDFLRVGAPLTVLMLIVTLVMVNAVF